MPAFAHRPLPRQAAGHRSEADQAATSPRRKHRAADQGREARTKKARRPPHEAASRARTPRMTRHAARLFRMPIALRWRDLDAFNHVNNSSFLTYLEEARIRWFESLGRRVGDRRASRRCWPRCSSTTGCRSRTRRTRRRTVRRAHRHQQRDHRPSHRVAKTARRCTADGHVVMVWIDRASGRPIPLPDDRARRHGDRSSGVRHAVNSRACAPRTRRAARRRPSA